MLLIVEFANKLTASAEIFSSSRSKSFGANLIYFSIRNELGAKSRVRAKKETLNKNEISLNCAGHSAMIAKIFPLYVTQSSSNRRG